VSTRSKAESGRTAATRPARKQREHQRFKPQRGRPTAAQAEAISRTILEAATRHFLAQGYELATMEAIASAAGVPKSTLYKRFPDKKALLRAVVENRLAAWGQDSSRTQPAPAATLAKRLKQRLQTLLDWSATDEIRAFSRMALGVGEGAQVIARVMRESGNPAVIETLVADIHAFQPDARDPESVANALMYMLAGWVGSQPLDRVISRNESAAFADRAVELIIHGRKAW